MERIFALIASAQDVADARLDLGSHAHRASPGLSHAPLDEERHILRLPSLHRLSPARDRGIPSLLERIEHEVVLRPSLDDRSRKRRAAEYESVAVDENGLEPLKR